MTHIVHIATEDLTESIPPEICRLIHPDVLEMRTRRIRAILSDSVREQVLRRRCAEIVANHLLGTLEDVGPLHSSRKGAARSGDRPAGGD